MAYDDLKLALATHQSRGTYDIFVYEPDNGDGLTEMTTAGYFTNSRYNGADADNADWPGSIIFAKVDPDIFVLRVSADGISASQVGGLGDIPVFTGEFTSGAQALPAGQGIVSVAHGLASVPKTADAYLVNVTDEAGYVAGDRVKLIQTSTGATTDTISLAFDATNVVMTFSTTGPVVGNKATGAPAVITRANWNLVLVALA